MFGIVYFVYLLEAFLMHSLLVKSSCRHSFLGQKIMTHFSSETLRFVRRVKGSKGPNVAVQQFRDAPPVFLMRMDTYPNRQRYKAGLKPTRTAAARMRMTFWRDETQDIVGLVGKRHAKLWLKKTLCFDGYSTATYFEKRRKAFISKHATPGQDFQCYTEELVVPDFKDYGIWSKPRNILIGSLPYLICTFAGVSWFYRMFVECATSPFEVEIFKMISNNDHTKRLGKKWRVVSDRQLHVPGMHLYALRLMPICAVAFLSHRRNFIFLSVSTKSLQKFASTTSNTPCQIIGRKVGPGLRTLRKKWCPRLKTNQE